MFMIHVSTTDAIKTPLFRIFKGIEKFIGMLNSLTQTVRLIYRCFGIREFRNVVKSHRYLHFYRE